LQKDDNEQKGKKKRKDERTGGQLTRQITRVGEDKENRKWGNCRFERDEAGKGLVTIFEGLVFGGGDMWLAVGVQGGLRVGGQNRNHATICVENGCGKENTGVV